MSPADVDQVRAFVEHVWWLGVALGTFLGWQLAGLWRVGQVRRLRCRLLGHDWLHDPDQDNEHWCTRCHRVENRPTTEPQR